MIGLLALAANSICLYLLWRHRADDVNMRSVWLCSRNDIIANTSVLAAAVGLWLTASQWPDLLIGLGIAALFLHSSLQVLRDATRTYRAHNNSLHGSAPSMTVLWQVLRPEKHRTSLPSTGRAIICILTSKGRIP